MVSSCMALDVLGKTMGATFKNNWYFEKSYTEDCLLKRNFKASKVAHLLGNRMLTTRDSFFLRRSLDVLAKAANSLVYLGK